jgi:DNA-binding transcriptional LysR family regulator
MSDRRLQVFQTVARLLSFTKAAEALHMTQPAVTFQIRQLEEYFNTRLFDRTHNRISLTPAGEEVAAYAERIFELYHEMENSVREMTGEIRGSVTLGASATVAEYLLPALLGKFKAEYPDVKVRLKVSNTEGIVSMIEDNVIDLGIVEAPVLNKNLHVEICLTDQLVVITPTEHPLAKKPSVNIREVVQLPFICREEGSGTREVIVEYLVAQGGEESELDICLELGSPEAIKGAVEAGMGVSILSLASISKELKLGTLCGIPLNPPLDRPFSFIRQRQKFRHRAMEELLRFAQVYCQGHSHVIEQQSLAQNN